MGQENATDDDTRKSPEFLRQARRDRWAPTLAILAVIGHAFATLCVFGWYYFIVPRWKKDLDDMGVALSPAAIFLINLSDSIVNYWYMLVPVAFGAVICDFLLTRWIGKQSGLRWAGLCAACIAVGLLANVAVGKYIVEREMSRLLEHVSVHGPPPKSGD